MRCFIATQNFKLKNITRCELWKRQIQPWIVTLLFGTIQHWFCLFHSSHLVMCFNLKFCVAIKHHPLNIPHFFQFFFNCKTSFSRGFHRFPSNVGFRMRSDWLEPKPDGSYLCTIGCSQIERQPRALSTAPAELPSLLGFQNRLLFHATPLIGFLPLLPSFSRY